VSVGLDEGGEPEVAGGNVGFCHGLRPAARP
jgi:hypothetical protein